VVARPDILEFVNRAREPFNVNALAQVAAVAALSDLEHVTRSRQMNHAGKEQLYRGFEALGLPYIPTEANFILVHVGRDSNEMFREMLKRGVIVRSGAYFDLNGYLRVSIGTRTENQRFLDVLDAVLAVTNKPAGS
jgi:histidinol-phosphate aminotransferase